MSVAELYPARVGADGRAWFRPVRPAGVDLSQWGWTSQPGLAHPDYGQGPHVVVHTPSSTAVLCGGPGACVACDEDRQTGGLHREGTCGGDCSGCVGDGEGGPTAVEAARLRTEAWRQAAGVAVGGPVDDVAVAWRDPLARRMVALDEARRAIEATGVLW
ncbi:hypothetical protein SEA_TBOND007_79 [Mycobacterium phage TBond007]|uniref:Uncharacterized protein n=1 Tax=Mycobacterium phage TBond007 TaxID=1897424 RepID=A0A1D8ES15_9CAUD|nr:hypothetical protein SEA_TBOND007_79 [Mycobacterium phage TBond007]